MNFSVISSNLSSKATEMDVTKKICNALIIPQLLNLILIMYTPRLSTCAVKQGLT